MTALRGCANRARRWPAAGRPLAGNLAAQIGALAALALATVLVARLDGPAGVGDFAILRLLPWLLAVVLSGGLPSAVSYFLAGPERENSLLPPTIAAMAVASGALGAAVWVALTPAVHAVFLSDLAVAVVAWAALKVVSRLLVITAKACAQGLLDPAGSNLVILLEELSFLPAYAVVLALGARGGVALVAALVLSDGVTASIGWLRIVSRGFWGAGRAFSAPLARRILAFGMRAQLGSLMTLVNLRLDFLLLGALAGSAVLGTYAIASRYAELLRLPPLAVYWVFYPRFARAGPAAAAAQARALIPRLGLLSAGAAAPLALAAPLVIPLLYGAAFQPAVLAAQLLCVGLVGEGFGGVVTALLYGTGRPGLNSMATAAGLATTVCLDLLLIPRHGLLGAAVASCAAYAVTTLGLLACFWFLTRSAPAQAPAEVGRT